jgi:hypothetical protein
MGLALVTNFLADQLVNDAEGAEWFEQKVALVNELLVAEGLPPHVEPRVVGAAEKRSHVSSFPYSFLHYLRRAFARLREGLAVTPVPEGADPTADPAIADASSTFDSHLLCHSDCEGYYVPIAFDDVIFDPDDRGLPGGMLGSSQRLLAELHEVAPAIGIELQHGVLSDAQAAALAPSANEDSHPLWHERLVWLALYENARVSIANQTMIVFC